MKILHVDMGREMRGGQHQALLLIRYLVQDGHENTLLARRHSPLWEAAHSVRGLKVGCANLTEVWTHSRTADIVHAHDAHSHTASVIAAWRPVVVSRRVAFPIGQLLVSGLKYRRAARFLAVSHFVAKQLQAGGIDPVKIDVIHDSVELLNSSQPSWRCEGPVVALATHDPLKGRRLLEQVARQFDIPILFAPDLVSDLDEASLFVYITESEGLGSAALLAMARCVPVIASRVGGLPEVVQHNVTGLLVDNNPADIGAAITRLRNEPGLAERLSRVAYAYVHDEFSVERMVESTMASYRKAIGG